jgi:hypothetical protein
MYTHWWIEWLNPWLHHLVTCRKTAQIISSALLAGPCCSVIYAVYVCVCLFVSVTVCVCVYIVLHGQISQHVSHILKQSQWGRFQLFLNASNAASYWQVRTKWHRGMSCFEPAAVMTGLGRIRSPGKANSIPMSCKQRTMPVIWTTKPYFLPNPSCCAVFYTPPCPRHRSSRNVLLQTTRKK